MSKDYLRLNSENSFLEFDINYGYVDSIVGAYDFKTCTPQNITNYQLSLNIEGAGKQALLQLEKILRMEETIVEAIISLDGIIQKGKAKLATIFSFDGISYDLELIN